MIERFFGSRADARAFAEREVFPYLEVLSKLAQREFVNALVLQAPAEIDCVSYPMVYRALHVAGIVDIPARLRFDFPPCCIDIDVLSEPLFLSLALVDLVGERLAVAVVGEHADTVWVRDPGDVLHLTGPIALFEEELERRREPPCLSWGSLCDELEDAGAEFGSPPDVEFATAPMGPLPSELASAGWLEG